MGDLFPCFFQGEGFIGLNQPVMMTVGNGAAGGFGVQLCCQVGNEFLFLMTAGWGGENIHTGAVDVGIFCRDNL